MSEFGYMSEGELNSQYLLSLINEYLTKAIESNNDQSSNNKLANEESSNAVRFLQKLQVFLQTNVLPPQEIVEIKKMLETIGFNKVIPIIEYGRTTAICKSEKLFLSGLKEIKRLTHMDSEYVLFNSPVEEIKPFLSDKTSRHPLDVDNLQGLIRQFISKRNLELNDFDNIQVDEVKLSHDISEFYDINITENGVGAEIEDFVRSQMLRKFEINFSTELSDEDKKRDRYAIDFLLKRVGLYKVEQQMESLLHLKVERANVKDVVEQCKEMLSKSTLLNKEQIFLAMDGMYYKLSNKCDKLQQAIKTRLQSLDKDKVFNLISKVQGGLSKKIAKMTVARNSANSEGAGETDSKTGLNHDQNPLNDTPKTVLDAELKAGQPEVVVRRAYNDGLYDEDEDLGIDISEDDTSDDLPEGEVVINDEDDENM